MEEEVEEVEEEEEEGGQGRHGGLALRSNGDIYFGGRR